MSNRVFNFCAGPCTLPLSVLEEAQAEFVDFQGLGMSILEMSHRSPQFMEIQKQTQDLLRSLYKLPDDFSVLLIQGGATMQFAMLPMNLLHSHQKAAYTLTGTWAKKAFEDAKVVGDSYIAWDGSNENFTRMPNTSELDIQANTRYLHITSNETIGGIRYANWPEVDVPMVADMSSDFLSRAIDWSKFDVVYGGVQKNLAPAGLSVVFIRNSILEDSQKQLPKYLRYDIHQSNDSMFNTPAVFPTYMMLKTLRWMEAKGGIDAMDVMANEKSAMLYGVIDKLNDFYKSPVDKASRSLMNVVFRLPTEALEKTFITEAASNGMEQLKGHRSVGGCRASIYNAMPKEGVEALASFMETFAAKNG